MTGETHMNFEKELKDALRITQLEKVDKRLDMPSELSPVTSNTKHMPKLNQIITPEPGLPNTNFQKQQVYLREANEDELRRRPREDEEDIDSMLEKGEEEFEDDGGLGPTEEEGALPDEDITDADLPEPEEQEVPGLPSGSKYTLQQAKGQLDGVIRQWMDLSGNYPEGDKRHNFLEIGERLREITAVIQRDYLEAQEGI